MVATCGSFPAYRIEVEDKILVNSGDTEPSPRLAALAEGADLLIHECSFPEPFDVTNHSTPKKLGLLLKNVKRVVLTHFCPQAEGYEEDWRWRGASCPERRCWWDGI